MRTLPRALHRARLWTTGLLTASTVLVGALGFHLADAHAQSLAARTPGATTNGSSSSGSSGDDLGQDSGSGFSDQDSGSGLSNQGLSNQGSGQGSGQGSSQGSSQGFSPVGPVSGGGFQPMTNSGGS